MRHILVFFMIFWSFGTLAQVREKFVEEYDSVADRISDDYEAGAYLMYDCKNQHYVCVLEEYFKSCKAQRLEEDKNTNLTYSCAPFGKLETKKSCFQKQLFMVSNNVATPDCTKEKWKKKELFFN